MYVTYFVALPFLDTEEGPVPGEGTQAQTRFHAIAEAERLSRKPGNVGAVAFSRRGAPEVGEFDDAVLIKAFGIVPDEYRLPAVGSVA
jgi:hypothetical protein